MGAVQWERERFFQKRGEPPKSRAFNPPPTSSRNVINLFGMPNRERIGLKTIRRLVDALKKGGHQVISLEADKDLVERLEDFMPQVVRGERPGMVFNVSYGLQGQARYTHVPSILEMVGIPYVGSGPLGHSLALDKVVTKMLLRQRGVPTPDFAVLDTPDAELPPDLAYPMIVKPKNEAVSFGLKIVNDEADLREASGVIYSEFRQPVLAEQYVEGREINVGVLGNDPVEAFQPVLLDFGDGAQIYTYEDKTGRSGRQIRPVCPAPIGDELTEKAREIAILTFNVLGLNDCARVDMRLDEAGQLYVLEANSLPSLGEHGSYLVGADHAGLDFTGFVNRLVDVATARYFGVPGVRRWSGARRMSTARSCSTSRRAGSGWSGGCATGCSCPAVPTTRSGSSRQSARQGGCSKGSG